MTDKYAQNIYKNYSAKRLKCEPTASLETERAKYPALRNDPYPITSTFYFFVNIKMIPLAVIGCLVPYATLVPPRLSSQPNSNAN